MIPSKPEGFVTIEDVAREAGVSVATVSRALRDLANVAPGTRERVKTVAARLNYVADPTASRLAAGRTGTVAVAVPVFDAWYFSTVVAGIEAVLSASSVDLLLYSVPSEVEQKRFFLGRGAWWRRSDALGLVDIFLPALEAERLHEQGAKIVTVGSSHACFSSVTVQNREAAIEAMKHLFQHGHTRIGLITGEPLEARFSSPVLRLEGARQALQDHGVEPDPALEQSGGFSAEGGREAMAKLLDLSNPPTAVFAFSDEMAFGAIDELHRRGKTPGRDVAVLGFDNMDLSEIFGLTTMDQDADNIGATAGRLLLQAIQPQRATPEHVIAPVKLVKRHT